MSNVHDLSSKLNARKAVILTRVSSREQEDGYSIDAQKHRLELYCLRRKLDVIKTFEITESSTQGDRHKFMSMIKFIKGQRETIALVADKVDRVQRSFKEYPLLDELIQKGQIELHFNTENYIIHKDSASQERLMWSMGVIMAQSYIDSMRDNVKRSFEQKIRQGEWIASAPIGYLNTRDEHGRSNIVIDHERALLVRKLFQDYATGAFTLSEITKKAKNWGLRNKSGKKSHLNRSHIYKILNNPFYHGKMKIKGALHPHRYEPLISLDVFNQCQAVMKSWHKQPFEYAGKEFVFRGLISCSVSGKTVTADTKSRTYKNGNTAEWTYLRCWNPENPEKKLWVREEVILSQVEKVFQDLHIPEPTLNNVIAYIRDTGNSEKQFFKRQVEELQKAQTRIQTRLDQLVDLLLDGVIDRDEYGRKKLHLESEQEDNDDKLKSYRAGDNGFKEALIALVSLCSNAHELFRSSTIEKKRLLVKLVFANLEMKGEKLDYALNRPFDMFIKTSDCSEWSGLVDRLRTNPELRSSILCFVDSPIFMSA